MARASTDRRRDVRGVATRQSLLATAERLFATHGIARTSTRQITGESGASSDAVHYYFGSKAGLVAAVLDWRLGQLRAGFVETFADAGRAASVRDVARTLVTAAAEMAGQESGRYYHPFLIALLNDHELSHLARGPSPQVDVIIEHLAPLTPYLTDTERLYRSGQALLLVLHGVGETPVTDWVKAQVDVGEDAAVEMLADVVTGVLGCASSLA